MFDSGRRLLKKLLQKPCCSAPSGAAKDGVFRRMVSKWYPISPRLLVGGSQGRLQSDADLDRRLLIHALYSVGVGVQGEAHGGMAQTFADDLRMDSLS